MLTSPCDISKTGPDELLRLFLREAQTVLTGKAVAAAGTRRGRPPGTSRRELELIALRLFTDQGCDADALGRARRLDRPACGRPGPPGRVPRRLRPLVRPGRCRSDLLSRRGPGRARGRVRAGRDPGQRAGPRRAHLQARRDLTSVTDQVLLLGPAGTRSSG